MKRMNLRRNSSVVLLTGGLIAATSALAQPQSGQGPGGMMGSYGENWMGGHGFGGMWGLILIVIVVAALVAWVVAQKKK